MRTLILSLFLLIAPFQNGGNYRITGNHIVVIERYDYSFQWPEKWVISSTSGAPYFFNFSPKYLDSPGVHVGVPRGGAEIGIVADAESHQAGSIDKWMKLDTTARGLPSIHELRLPPATTIRRAVEAIYFQDDGDSKHKQITRITTIYFEFQGHVLAAELRYNAKDPKGREYEDTLMAVVSSFRPLDEPGRAK